MKRLLTFLLAILLNCGYCAAHTDQLRTIPKESAALAGQLCVEYNGRTCPLQTFAIDFTSALYGKTHYNGYTSEQVLLGWMLYFDDWNRHSVIKGKDEAALRAQLTLIAALHDGLLPQLTTIDTPKTFINQLRHYADRQDWTSLNQLLRQTAQNQQQTTNRQKSTATSIRAELTYNSLTPNLLLSIVTILIGGLLLAFQQFYDTKKWLQKCNLAGLVLLCLLFIYLLTLFILRCFITGQLPLNNTYDTLLFIALCGTLFTLVFHKKQNLLLAFGWLVAGFAMLTAQLVTHNATIALRPKPLDSPLLAVHVSVTMLAYALFAFITLNALVALLSKCRRSDNSGDTGLKLMLNSQKLLLPALLLLAAGIVLGSVWAKRAWGSYWQWDPKETWALITAILYGLLLWTGAKKGRDAHPDRYHILALVCFACVLFTYFGVNYLLGGLHSYAN